MVSSAEHLLSTVLQLVRLVHSSLLAAAVQQEAQRQKEVHVEHLLN